MEWRGWERCSGWFVMPIWGKGEVLFISSIRRAVTKVSILSYRRGRGEADCLDVLGWWRGREATLPSLRWWRKGRKVRAR